MNKPKWEYTKENPNDFFDRVPSKAFPREETLACPHCKGTDVWLIGKNLLGQGVNKTECRNPDCGYTVVLLEH
jgi:hypothetical protein